MMYVCWLILLFIISSQVSCYSVIHVNPSTSKNATAPGTLQYYLCSNGSESLEMGTILSLASHHGHHTLLKGTPCLLSHLYNITLSSDSPSRLARIVCEGGSSSRGLAFLNITSLTLYGLSFTNCGSQLSLIAIEYINNSRLYFPLDLNGVLLIVNCYNVRMNHVTISGNYCGYAMIISHSYSVLLHTVSLLHGNKQKCKKPVTFYKDNSTCNSSGLLLFYCDLDNHFYDDNSSENNKKTVSLMHVTITCHSMTKRQQQMERFLKRSYKVPVNSVSAGGLTLYVMGEQNVANFTFLQVKIKGNRGGGALILYTLLEDDSYNSSPPIYMLQSTLSQNVLQGNGGSLAVYIISQLHTPMNSLKECIVCLMGCSITDSSAVNGFGGGIYIAVGSTGDNWVPPIILQESIVFLGNSASKGASTIYVHGFSTSSSLSKVSYQVNLIITLKGVYISNNGAIRNSDTGPLPNIDHEVYFTEIATTQFINIKSVIIGNQTVFDYNFGSAVSIFSTSLLIKGHVQLIHNRGVYGGAIYLKSNSILLIHSTALVNFTHNNAYSYGGAIYSDCNYCPIHFMSENKGFLTFTGNNAFLEGDAIYFKGLQYCHNSTLMKHILSLTHSKSAKHHSISSPPIHLIFCINQQRFYDYGAVYPGTHLKLSISAVDKNNHRVYSPIKLSVTSTNLSYDISAPWYLPSEHNIQLVYDMKCTQINLTILQRLPNLSESSKSFIEFGVIGQLPTLSLMFTMQHCPLGFQLRNEKCDCHDYLYENRMAKYCNINTLTISLETHGSWVGVVNYNNNTNTLSPYNDRHTLNNDHNTTGLLAYAFVCPSGYCKKHSHGINVSNWNSHCYGHRSGILCGGCQEDYTVAWGTTECVKCPHYNIWAVIAIPVGSIIVIFILFLIRLDISNGTLGSIIFYANVYAASINPPEHTLPMYMRVFYFFLACLNDTINFPICICSHLTSITKASSFFVFPLFLISTVLALIVISRYSVKVSNFIAPSSIQVLATLIYLSFAKLLLTTINILLPVYIHSQEGIYLVWYVDGNVPYWGNSGHIILTFLAIIVIVAILLPFLVFTTFGGLLLRCRYLRPYLMYVRPFLDAYQGPFKNRFKYWFGLRLWILFHVYVCFVVLRGRQPTLMLQLQGIPIFLFTIGQAWVRPYRKTLVNLIDIFILFNMCVTLVVKITLQKSHKDTLHFLPYLSGLILLIVLLFIGLVLYHTFQVLKNKLVRRERERRQMVVQSQGDVSKYTREYEVIPDNSNNQLREPLLENHY